MKTLNTLIFCLLIGFSALAQEPVKKDSVRSVTKGELKVEDGKLKGSVKSYEVDSTYVDTTKIELKNAYITIVSKGNDDWDDDDWEFDGTLGGRKYRLTWWNGIDLGLNGIVGPNRDMKFPEGQEGLRPDLIRSRYISFNFAQVKLRLFDDYVGLTTGLSIQIYNWKYGGSNEFLYQNDSLLIVPNTTKNITKNKLRAEYLAVPLLLEFNTSLDPSKAFHISVGVVGKVRMGNMYKQKYEIDGNRNKQTIKGDYGFNRWAVDATARIGWRRLTVYGQMGMLPLFETKNVNDLYSFSAGFFIKI